MSANSTSSSKRKDLAKLATIIVAGHLGVTVVATAVEDDLAMVAASTIVVVQIKVGMVEVLAATTKDTASLVLALQALSAPVQ